MKETIVNGTVVYSKNKFEIFYTKLIGKKITLFWVWCLVLGYGLVSLVFGLIYQNIFWGVSCIVATLLAMFGIFLPLKKVIFTFKPLSYFFGSKRKYENHVKNVLSAVKKNTKDYGHIGC